ncbi:ADP-ribose pyrophosphatase YjhB (NUDIX family) [Haloactinospora alba]|uniref:ADP-ribose pyrophosphatase YjhB (NUDIX family) n=1 Tax=Haloactinospora alba TaxID=405555 RepID=A0A543NIQ1_9ACTN|nr:NUDIX hydrolase [Haloactinospora alba]TQN31706.1 ADP-ribose pyrophosphatase YjhB (NUDIX family) [Haloactinospora alba]
MAATEREFYDALPRSRGAATALLRTGDGRVLVVNPTYKPGWGMPGGVVEQGESPLAACRRECREELGFVPRLWGLVGVDWLPPDVSPDQRPATIFVFAGGLEQEDLGRVRLPEEELSEATLLWPEELGDYLNASVARRITQSVRAASHGSTVYLEHGFPVDWTG